MKQAFWIGLGIVVIAMATFYVQLRQTRDSVSEIRLQVSDCDVAEQACLIDYQGISYRLAMTRPRGLKPFQLTFSSTTGELAKVTVQFDMLGMDMQQPTQLLEQTEATVWQKQAILPICSSGRSDWVAWIRFRYQGDDYRLQFPFTVY